MFSLTLALDLLRIHLDLFIFPTPQLTEQFPQVDHSDHPFKQAPIEQGSVISFAPWHSEGAVCFPFMSTQDLVLLRIPPLPHVNEQGLQSVQSFRYFKLEHGSVLHSSITVQFSVSDEQMVIFLDPPPHVAEHNEKLLAKQVLRSQTLVSSKWALNLAQEVVCLHSRDLAWFPCPHVTEHSDHSAHCVYARV